MIILYLEFSFMRSIQIVYDELFNKQMWIVLVFLIAASFFGKIPSYSCLVHGGVTGNILENHVRENIGWILFKTRNFYIFLDIQ